MADRTPDPNDPRRGMQPRPKRGRVLLIGTFVGLIALVFLFMTLVTQCSTTDDAPQGAGASAAVVADDSGPARVAT